MKTRDAVMREVTDWLELDTRDMDQGFCRSRFRRSLSVPHRESPGHNSHAPSSSGTDLPGPSHALLELVALQMLASCYTSIPGTSAENRPIYSQYKGPTTVSALRLHSRARFSPAAGHHARECSESYAWPGLYNGPSIEEQLAERVSERRRLKKRQPDGINNSSYGPVLEGSGRPNSQRAEVVDRATKVIKWSDGPSEEGEGRRSAQTSRGSSRAPHRSLLEKWSGWVCYPIVKKPKRTLYRCMPASHLPHKHRETSLSPPKPARASPAQKVIARIPAVRWPRRTQSAPRKSSQDITDMKITRRGSSSTPAFPSPWSGQVPEIRYISATTIDEPTAILRDPAVGGPVPALSLLDSTSLSPWSCWISRQTRSAPSSAASSISPFSIVESTRGARGKRTDYFGRHALATLKDSPRENYEVELDSGTEEHYRSDERDSDDDDTDTLEGSESSSMLEKRRSRYFSAMDFAAPQRSPTMPITPVGSRPATPDSLPRILHRRTF